MITLGNRQVTNVNAPTIVCGGCAQGINKALAALEGVTDVKVDVAEKRVTVEHDESLLGNAILDTLGRAGFPASLEAEVTAG
jgi:copper chaperone CopZ